MAARQLRHPGHAAILDAEAEFHGLRADVLLPVEVAQGDEEQQDGPSNK